MQSIQKSDTNRRLEKEEKEYSNLKNELEQQEKLILEQENKINNEEIISRTDTEGEREESSENEIDDDYRGDRD